MRGVETIINANRGIMGCYPSRRRHWLRGYLSIISFMVGAGLASAAGTAAAQASETQSPPNFLVVLADDLGWADIGAFGSEIRTPNIDKLAGQGTIMSQFYASPSCAPSRAMLLTGLSSHEAGRSS